jgi:hypothetical protein
MAEMTCAQPRLLPAGDHVIVIYTKSISDDKVDILAHRTYPNKYPKNRKLIYCSTSICIAVEGSLPLTPEITATPARWSGTCRPLSSRRWSMAGCIDPDQGTERLDRTGEVKLLGFTALHQRFQRSRHARSNPLDTGRGGWPDDGASVSA